MFISLFKYDKKMIKKMKNREDTNSFILIKDAIGLLP